MTGPGTMNMDVQAQLSQTSKLFEQKADISFDLLVYVKGKHLSYQRGKRNTNPNTSLLKIEGVEDTNAAKYVPYLMLIVPSLERGGHASTKEAARVGRIWTGWRDEEHGPLDLTAGCPLLLVYSR